MEYELTCCVCLDLYKEPVTLPCSHSLCRGCLNTVANASGDPLFLKPFNCPTCRFFVQRHHFLELKENKLLSNIVLAYRKDKDTTGAVPQMVCYVHPTEQLLLYCQSCKKAICSYCVTEVHYKYSHRVSYIEHLIEDEKEAVIKLLKETDQTLQEKKAKLVRQKHAILTEKDAAERVCLSLMNQLKTQFLKIKTDYNRRIDATVRELTAAEKAVESRASEFKLFTTAFESLTYRPDRHCHYKFENRASSGKKMKLMFLGRELLTFSLAVSMNTSLQIEEKQLPSFGLRNVEAVQEAIQGLELLVSNKNTERDQEKSLEELIEQGLEYENVRAVFERAIRNWDVGKAERSKGDSAKAEKSKEDRAKAEKSKEDGAKVEKSKEDGAKAEKSREEGAKAEKSEEDRAKVEKSKEDTAMVEKSKVDDGNELPTPVVCATNPASNSTATDSTDSSTGAESSISQQAPSSAEGLPPATTTTSSSSPDVSVAPGTSLPDPLEPPQPSELCEKLKCTLVDFFNLLRQKDSCDAVDPAYPDSNPASMELTLPSTDFAQVLRQPHQVLTGRRMFPSRQDAPVFGSLPLQFIPPGSTALSATSASPMFFSSVLSSGWLSRGSQDPVISSSNSSQSSRSSALLALTSDRPPKQSAVSSSSFLSPVSSLQRPGAAASSPVVPSRLGRNFLSAPAFSVGASSGEERERSPKKMARRTARKF